MRHIPEITDPIVQQQILHITMHNDAFVNHAGSDRTVEEYFNEYLSEKPDIYERLCSDLGITPEPSLLIQEAPVTTGRSTDTDIQALVQSELARALGGLGALTAQPQSFEDALSAVDPADSDSALAMLDFLLKTGRLGRVGVLDGGQGYLFVYQEPKGSTKQGYKPGATQGDRIVDGALEGQRSAGTTPASEKGMCPHCFSVVRKESDALVNDETGSPECSNSPDGKHELA